MGDQRITNSQLRQDGILAAAVPAASVAFTQMSPQRTFFAQGFTSAGAGTATIIVEASLDGGTTFAVIGTITLVLSTTLSGDGFAINARWPLTRFRITAISGTGAAVSTFIGG